MAETTKSAGNGLKRAGNGLKAQRVISLMITAVGVVLLTFMITVEDEPGALPLALVIGGFAWFFITRARIRATVSKEVQA